MKWYNTLRPLKSCTVQKLIESGRGHEIMKAIKNEQKSNTGTGTHNEITVKRVDRK